MLFFFSSRRRHTSSLCDWSSDVCSSDLGHLGVGADGGVGLVLDVAEGPIVDPPVVAEVEAQALGRDERAGLLHVLAQSAAEGGVEEVRGGTVDARGVAAGGIDAGVDAVAR